MINGRLFTGIGINDSLTKAIEWINKEHIDVINISESRSLIFHNGVFVIFREFTKDKQSEVKHG